MLGLHWMFSLVSLVLISFLLSITKKEEIQGYLPTAKPTIPPTIDKIGSI